MKLVEAMYGWNQNSDEIDVGPWPDTTGWSDRYSLTGGACYTNIRQMSPDEQAAQIFIDFHMIVLSWTLHNSVSCRPQALIQKKSWVAINSRA
jgi:hypothetical protein